MDMMENVAENMFYENYNQRVEVSFDALIVSMWNRGGENKVFLNNKEFFENSFESAYDAACAVSFSGKWRWEDDFVYVDEGGYLASFSHWDDENSPIDADRLDISQLIEGMKKWPKKDKKEQEGSISIMMP